MKSVSVIILAAGLGTRMKSSRPKVMHTIFDRPMLQYSIDTATGMKPTAVVLVVNSAFDAYKAELSLPSNVSFAIQKEQKGTAHALISALPSLKKSGKDTIIVTTGDTPLITPATLKSFLGLHRKSRNAISVLSFEAQDPHGYGRIVRSQNGRAAAIVEEKDATHEERHIHEVNSGVYAIEPDALALLKSIKVNKLKGEFYLTDLLSLAISKGMKADVYCAGEEEEFHGINSREDLAMAFEIMRMRKTRALMESGVTVMDPYSTYIAPDTIIGPDTIIYPNVFIHAGSEIGRGCTIYPNCRIKASQIMDGAEIYDSSIIEKSKVGRGAHVGPFGRIRPDSDIADGAHIGNFVEIKKSRIGKGTKAMHLSYIGDAEIGAGANIGAGTITCNYDGINKHKTTIGDSVFIGSDTQLVAPVTVGKGAYVGAGSTITKDVEPDSLAVSRTRQTNYKDWAKGRKKKK